MPLIAEWQLAYMYIASFRGNPVPESILCRGPDGNNSMEFLCFATLPILLHIMYQIPATIKKVFFRYSDSQRTKNDEWTILLFYENVHTH